jgi:hypothetical protein
VEIDFVRFRDQVRERFRDFECITPREAMTHKTMLSGLKRFACSQRSEKFLSLLSRRNFYISGRCARYLRPEWQSKCSNSAAI